MSTATWHEVSNPILPEESIPPQYKTVLVWLDKEAGARVCALPFCGYIKYAAGDKSCPYFVVYHGNTKIGANVRWWSDCLPDNGPPIDLASLYNRGQTGQR